MEFVAYTKNTVTKNSLLVMEKHILRVIQFQVTQTSPYRFLERYSKVAKVAQNSTVFYLAQYLLELALLDSKMNQYLPSLQASAALCVAQKMNQIENLKEGSTWSKHLQEVTRYSQSYLEQCSKNMKHLAYLIQGSNRDFVLNKFSQSKFLRVAKLASSAINRSKEQIDRRASSHPSHPKGDHSCDKSTRGGSSSKHCI